MHGDPKRLGNPGDVWPIARPQRGEEARSVRSMGRVNLRGDVCELPGAVQHEEACDDAVHTEMNARVEAASVRHP